MSALRGIKTAARTEARAADAHMAARPAGGSGAPPGLRRSPGTHRPGQRRVSLSALTTVKRLLSRHCGAHVPRRRRRAARRVRRGRTPAGGAAAPEGCLAAASSGRHTDFGGGGGPGGGAAVNRGRGGQFNWAGWVSSLELPEQLFVGPAQPLLLLGLFLNVLLEVSVFLGQLSARGEEDSIKQQSCHKALAKDACGDSGDVGPPSPAALG